MAARETALNVLIACRKEAGWSNSLLKQRLAADGLDRREAALATRLCYGVVQNRGKLDFYLQQLLTGKANKLHPAVRDILHLGLYQMLEMDRIPASAAVNESVVLAKKYCKKQPGAHALVNAVLRRASVELGSLQSPKSYVDRYSHPQALVDKLKSYVGGKALEAMLIANNQAPDTVVQVNSQKTTAQALQKAFAEAGVEAKPHPWLEGCLVLSGTGNIERLPGFREGHFYVQDAAARLSVLCAGLPQEGAKVLDCCAAPGGKSFAAAIAMAGRGEITACDIYPHRLELIQKGAQRLGFANIRAVQADASAQNPAWVGQMDAVIADVPCSGFGIIRKKPDIRYKDIKVVRELPSLQLAILKNQAAYVRPGGVLLYSTCTLTREENEGVVEAFLKEDPDFSLEKLPLPEVFPENESGMLSLIPGQYDTDGFFICRLRKKL